METRFDNIGATAVTRRGLLRRAGAGGLALAAVPLIGNAVALAAPRREEFDSMVGRFEMTILEGPETGAAIKGNLAVMVSKKPETRGDVIETVLVTDDFKAYFVSGNVNGQAMNIVLTGLDGKAITGTGAISMAQPMAGGPSVGPSPADFGTWWYQIMSRDSR
jgi:hypothetical protein